MPELPKRGNTSVNIKKIYDFAELIYMPKEDIQKRIDCNLYIENFDLLKNNFDLFLWILKNCKVNSVCSSDFQCLKYIEENLKDYINIKLSLMDDFQNHDRSYLELNQFEKCKIEIPLCYILWIPNPQENQLVSLGHHEYNLNAVSFNFWENISLENLKKIKEIIERIALQCSHLSDLEKAILISNYLQNSVQYVDENNISETIDGVYITDSRDMPVTNRDVSSPEVVLLQGYGKCAGIAAATTLLSNNPLINLKVRPIRNSSHAWNSIEINGKYYYIDNTWNITRNPDRFYESLKAQSFSSQYLFFGQETADLIGHHTPYILHRDIATYDIDRNQVLESIQKLAKSIAFDGYDKPVFESRLQK